MLELRPSCENCDKALPPAATDAKICTYECTFCADCVNNVLDNVCPNCAGGFSPRPIRPANEHRPGVYLGAHPANTEKTSKPVNKETQAELIKRVGPIAPHER
ncbi:MAG: DUF1272 domain-containing protein [Pseudomonadota bacterium]